MRTRIYAFTDDAGNLAFLKAAGTRLFANMRMESHGKMHALIGPEPATWPWQDSAQVTNLRLIHYHRVLGEAVRHFEKVIPASFESVFDWADAIPRALEIHQRELSELMGRYGRMRQFSLAVRWDELVMQQLLKRFGKDASALEKERRELRDQILLQLQGNLRDLIILDNNDCETVLQAVMLVDAAHEEKLVNLLQKIDQECRNRLHIRLVGPLPACNFARVEVKLPEPSRVKQACHDLGIGRAERLMDVKNAYRQKVKALHPDSSASADNHDLMVRVTRSYRYLTRLAAQQNNTLATNPDKQWLRCDGRALKQTPLLRIQRGITRWDDVVMKRGNA